MLTPVRLIDTHMHLHLAQFDGDRQAVIERALAAGVERMVEIGYDLESSRAAIALAERFEAIFAVVGIQPHYATVADSGWLRVIEHLAGHPKVVAIGEIGFDYYHQRAPQPDQERLFREQLALARSLGLPVVIHSRDAHADTVRVLRADARGLPGVMHSFSGDWAYAEACLEVGFLISFNGPVTFRNAHSLREVARRAPLDRILTETDSPYLSPHPLRGQRNEPARVQLVAQALADARGIALDELAAAVWHNAATIFQRS